MAARDVVGSVEVQTGPAERPAADVRLPVRLIYWLLVALFAVVVLAPLFAILKGSVTIPGVGGERFGLDAWITAPGRKSIVDSVWNTVRLAVSGQVVALPLSVLIAWLLGRTDLPGRRWLELAFWISFFLPVLSVLQGWVLLLDPHYGLVNVALAQLFGPAAPVFDIYTAQGIVFAHLITNTISAKVMMMTPAFQNMDSRLEEAAWLAGDSPIKTFFRVTLPLALPVIVATAMIGLIRTLESFEIEMVLGIPKNIMVYSTLIYDMIGNDPPDFAAASVLGVVVIVLLSLLAAVPSLVTNSDRDAAAGRFVTLSSHTKARPVPLGRWRYPAFAFVALVALILTVIPIVFLVASSLMTMFGFFGLDQVWTLDHWRQVLSDSVFVQSFRNTIVLAVTASALSIVFSTIVAYAIVRTPFGGRRLLSILSWVPSTMPGVLFSLALLWIILSNDLLITFYGSTFSLAVAVALASLTFAVQILKGNFAQIGGEMEEAAWVAGTARWRAILQIVVPLSIRSIAVVGVVAFISAARSIGQLSLLVSSDNRPLALLQLEFMTEGRYEPSAVVGVIVVCLAVVAALAIRRLGYRPAG